MEELQLIIDLHKEGQRQGPGGDGELEKVLMLSGLNPTQPLKIADIGCGTGAATLQLAERLNAQITAVDLLPEFLETLQERADQRGLMPHITPLCCAMDQLPFHDGEYDVIWSEGAIYNIGFQQGIQSWRPYLKANGLLVVSEITWTTAQRPPELEQHWVSAYPEIDTAAAKIAALEQSGYSPIAYFSLPEYCWLDNYYTPMQARFATFLDSHGQSAEAQALVASEKQEIALYQRYKAYYSYGMYIAQKRD